MNLPTTHLILILKVLGTNTGVFQPFSSHEQNKLTQTHPQLFVTCGVCYQRKWAPL